MTNKPYDDVRGKMYKDDGTMPDSEVNVESNKLAFVEGSADLNAEPEFDPAITEDPANHPASTREGDPKSVVDDTVRRSHRKTSLPSRLKDYELQAKVKLSKTWQSLKHPQNSSIPSKPDRAHIYTISGAIQLEYFSEDYDEELEMEPRPERTREITPPLRTRSPRVRRQCERIVGFVEEACFPHPERGILKQIRRNVDG
ncbi:hypothetical protein Tco_0222013 [Tanacetum coccineum]